MMRIRKFFTLIIFLYSLNTFAQNKGVYKSSVTAFTGGSAGINLPSFTSLNKQVKMASALIRSDFGGNYYFGLPGEGTDFSLRVSFLLKGYLGSSTVFNKSYSFDVDNNHPEGYLSRDLKEFIVTPGSLRQTGLDIDRLEISAVSITDLKAGSGGSYSTAKDAIRLYLSYEIEYGIDTRSKGNDIVLLTPTSDSPKSKLFQWQSSNPYPNYQFQILRLYNVNEANKIDEQIEAVVDWSKAVTIETESAQQQLSLTIAEGTGYYVWRVRPIGTFFPGGIANSNNWGDWNSPSPANGETLSLPLQGEKFFFFTDPDDDKNYIYSRTFSEENKIKETSTYANKLLQTKQSQVYIPSDNTTVTSQTVHDHVGRPALQTMPVPVDGKPGGYKENFVKANGKLYSEKDFDTDGTLNDPGQIDNTSLAGSYYDGNSVPSAQGYPFSRVLFYDDGTGRVKEQSGVGKDHMVGDQSSGRGRTVRTLYGTPSEDELVLLFGKEAPNHERVQKVITVDQNNIASINYAAADGKTIATALTFYDNDNQTLLPLSAETSIEVKDKISGGVKTNDAYVGSKRLVFTRPTTFATEYMVECQTFGQLCADIELECNYKVTVKITNIDNQTTYLLSKVLKDIECESVSICNKTSEYKVVRSGQWDGSVPELAPGTYIVEKRLEPAGDIKVELKNIKEKTEFQVKPFRDWIVGSLQNVQCPAELDTFYHNLVAFSKLVRNKTLSQSNTFVCEGCKGGISFSDTFWTIYSNPKLKPQFSLDVYNKDGLIEDNPYGHSPVAVILKTPCCDNLKLDVTYNPPFKCPPPNTYVLTATSNRPTDKGGNNSKLDVNYDFLSHPEYTEYFPDFEGYAISMLMECGDRDTAAAKDIFYSYMAGWKEGEFNLMIHHMLTDQYDCNGTNLNAPKPDDKWNTEPKAPDACTPASMSMIPNTQYRCADLARCWTNLVQLMSQSYCQSMEDILSEMKTNGTVSDGFDKQQEGGKKDKHDNTFDDGMKQLPGLVRWIAKKKMSARLRKMQMPGPDKPEEPEYVFHMVDMFLRCGGYKFADILEPAAPGNCGANGTAPAVFKVPTDFDGNLTNGEYNSCPYKTANWGETPIETGGEEGTTKKVKDLFPNIQNPIYAFKYFEYKEETYPNLEALTCFRDPNDCYYINSGGQKVVVPCCGDTSSSMFFCVKEYDHPRPDGTDQIGGPYKWLVRDFCGMGKIICPYLHEDWNCMERLAFFNMLKGYREFDEPYTPEPILTCSWMTTPREWYILPDDHKDSTILEYVDKEQFKKYTGVYPEQLNPPVSPVSVPGLAVVAGKTHYMSETLKDTITYVEYLANKNRKQCTETCEDRRDEFRAAVMQMFIDRCYVFDGCKRSALDNIIYPEDVEKIVDRVVLECQTQCPLTTYTCQTNQCRLFTTPPYEIGPNDEESKLELGTGGHPDRSSDCPAGVGQMKNCCTNTSGTPPITFDGMECNSSYQLSFYEQTNYLQAREWELKLDIVSMCNSEGIYADADNDGERDNYVLYYYDKNMEGKRVLLLQNQSNLSCNPRPPANTFVEKYEYDIRTTTPLPHLKSGTPVYSPKIGFTINGGN